MNSPYCIFEDTARYLDEIYLQKQLKVIIYGRVFEDFGDW